MPATTRPAKIFIALLSFRRPAKRNDRPAKDFIALQSFWPFC